MCIRCNNAVYNQVVNPCVRITVTIVSVVYSVYYVYVLTYVYLPFVLQQDKYPALTVRFKVVFPAGKFQKEYSILCNFT
jgi:hypothetical protein